MGILPNISIGDLVSHPIYGQGIVVKFERDRDKWLIKFDTAGPQLLRVDSGVKLLKPSVLPNNAHAQPLGAGQKKALGQTTKPKEALLREGATKSATTKPTTKGLKHPETPQNLPHFTEKKHEVYEEIVPLWTKLKEALSSALAQKATLVQPKRVSFVGRFKTGKSRLINALLDADILPYNTDECTAQLVELAFDDLNKASRLTGPELNTASEEWITIQQFNQAVDLTSMTEAERKCLENAELRRYLNHPLLRSMRLLDTPGFDGPSEETRERAERVRESAIKQSDVCVLVLDKGLGEDELKCARLIQKHAIDMIVVLNKSDHCDRENRSETKEKIGSDLASTTGRKAKIYACSALWQIGSNDERDEITDWRDNNVDDDENIDEWHEWNPLVRHLSLPQKRADKRLALLKTISTAFHLAIQIRERYDLEKQAELLFPDQISRWREMMRPPLGPLILDIALAASRAGKPLPWQRLQNFNIYPTMIAPQDILPQSELSAIHVLYDETLAELMGLAHDTHSSTLCSLLLPEIEQYIRLAENGLKVQGLHDRNSNVRSLQLCVKELKWFSEPLHADFSYQHALLGLHERWAELPSTMDDDCRRVRTQLAALLD